MRYIDTQDVVDGTLNLALEEYALTTLDIEETYLLFYSMHPTVIVGKNQNTLEEINTDYVRAHGVVVTRRLSGGGAVYNDEGDLSFSFITKHDANSFHNYRKFTEPVIRALRDLGVPAELSGRNDILVEGKKVSGNAQFATRGRMFSHGTLLFDVNLGNVEKALRVHPEKMESKGVKSVRSRVTNIRPYLRRDMDIREFKQVLLERIFDGLPEIPEYRLTEADWQAVRDLAERRYRSWDWVYGQSPPFNVRRTRYIPGVGLLDVRLYVERGRIEQCRMYGDFFGERDVSEIEQRLLGCRYDPDDLAAALADVDLRAYFGPLEHAELQRLLY
ncbi:MAG: lipoate--protein ligase [Alicyclobacillus macrosporangiidus]|uniref:lipoate--protein ligase n=1 Tax=Alicyclobacillus macrosporangiidus TaxID=392015 RepID=UPI0026EF395E|nr:lipoate--protein ligase [Alicyclobacillus macrosporangiidus]MCL6599675.1 lipoate--protein ligase [Alicyclobacillus macrosporangiidus]